MPPGAMPNAGVLVHAQNLTSFSDAAIRRLLDNVAASPARACALHRAIRGDDDQGRAPVLSPLEVAAIHAHGASVIDALAAALLLANPTHASPDMDAIRAALFASPGGQLFLQAQEEAEREIQEAQAREELVRDPASVLCRLADANFRVSVPVLLRTYSDVAILPDAEARTGTEFPGFSVHTTGNIHITQAARFLAHGLGCGDIVLPETVTTAMADLAIKEKAAADINAAASGTVCADPADQFGDLLLAYLQQKIRRTQQKNILRELKIARRTQRQTSVLRERARTAKPMPSSRDGTTSMDEDSDGQQVGLAEGRAEPVGEKDDEHEPAQPTDQEVPTVLEGGDVGASDNGNDAIGVDDQRTLEPGPSAQTAQPNQPVAPVPHRPSAARSVNIAAQQPAVCVFDTILSVADVSSAVASLREPLIAQRNQSFVDRIRAYLADTLLWAIDPENRTDFIPQQVEVELVAGYRVQLWGTEAQLVALGDGGRRALAAGYIPGFLMSYFLVLSVADATALAEATGPPATVATLYNALASAHGLNPSELLVVATRSGGPRAEIVALVRSGWPIPSWEPLGLREMAREVYVHIRDAAWFWPTDRQRVPLEVSRATPTREVVSVLTYLCGDGGVDVAFSPTANHTRPYSLLYADPRTPQAALLVLGPTARYEFQHWAACGQPTGGTDGLGGPLTPSLFHVSPATEVRLLKGVAAAVMQPARIQTVAHPWPPAQRPLPALASLLGSYCFLQALSVCQAGDGRPKYFLVACAQKLCAKLPGIYAKRTPVDGHYIYYINKKEGGDFAPLVALEIKMRAALSSQIISTPKFRNLSWD